MGGNDDYTGGLVFETTIREATLAAVQPRPRPPGGALQPGGQDAGLGRAGRVFAGRPERWEPGEAARRRAGLDQLGGKPRLWCAYILGDIYYLLMKFPEKVRFGFNLYLESEVPLGKGVSSSAALEVAPMKAMACLYGIPVQGVELASWTQWVEIALTGSACGIMDQLAVVMGDRDAFVPMLCQPCQPYPLVRLPHDLRLWGIDLGVRHAISGIEYESARAATFMGYRYLCEFERLQPVLDESGALPRYVDPAMGWLPGPPHPGSVPRKIRRTPTGAGLRRRVQQPLPHPPGPIHARPPGGDLPGARSDPLCRGRELAGEPVLRSDLQLWRRSQPA